MGVSPSPKVDEILSDADYCPVSILPTLSKVFEHLVLNQLIIYINGEAPLVLQYRDSERVIENLLFYWGSVTF